MTRPVQESYRYQPERHRSPIQNPRNMAQIINPLVKGLKLMHEHAVLPHGSSRLTRTPEMTLSWQLGFGPLSSRKWSDDCGPSPSVRGSSTVPQ